MQRKQEDQIRELIVDVLIPKIQEIYSLELYPKQFSCNLTQGSTQIIINTGVYIKLYSFDTYAELNYVALNKLFIKYHILQITPPLDECLMNQNDANYIYIIFTNVVNEKIILDDEKIKFLAQCMIDFIKRAEQYKKEIKDIIDFSNKISLSNTRNVLFEKTKFQSI